MMAASYYDDKIIVTSSQCVNPAESWRLQDAYQLLTKPYQDMVIENPDMTFIFEYISLKDPHVVQYPKEMQGLYLIGIRNKKTGYTINYNDTIKTAALYLGVKTTEVYKKSFSDVLDSLSKVRGNDAEGYVANIDGFRVKIKYDDYLAIKHLMDKGSVGKAVIKAIAELFFPGILF